MPKVNGSIHRSLSPGSDQWENTGEKGPAVENTTKHPWVS